MKKIINEDSYINEDRIEKYFRELVGPSGAAKTIEGELIRAINRMMYRYHNDGDFFFKGYGTETAGPCAVYLMQSNITGLKEVVNKASSLMADEGKNQYTDKDEYQKTLEKIGDIICDYIDSKNGQYTDNNDDCLNDKYYRMAKQMWYEDDDDDYEEDWNNYDDDEEENIEEKIGSKLSNLKISKFTTRDKVYATMQNSIEFTCIINNKSVKGYFSKTRQYTCDGVDINELNVDGKKIKICNGGGSYRTYEISIGAFPKKEKQPKNLSFTGPYYDISNLGNQFKNQLQKLIIEKPELLTDEFKTVFNINININPKEIELFNTLSEKNGSKLITSINEYKKITEAFPKKEPLSYVTPEGDMSNISTDKKLNDAVDAWLLKVTQKSNDEFTRNFPKLPKPSFTKKIGQKYIKIMEENIGQKSTWGFIDNQGNIYKSANYNTPAKGIRG